MSMKEQTINWIKTQIEIYEEGGIDYETVRTRIKSADALLDTIEAEEDLLGVDYNDNLTFRAYP